MTEMIKIGPDSVIAQKKDVLFTQLDDQVVLMSIESGQYHSLDPVGGRIWSLVEQPCSVAGMCDLLQQEYAVDAARCECEVLGFLQALADRGLVQVTAEPA